MLEEYVRVVFNVFRYDPLSMISNGRIGLFEIHLIDDDRNEIS